MANFKNIEKLQPAFKQLGKVLIERRKELGLSQEQVAKKMGKNRQSYQRLELGTTNPTLAFLHEIASVLEISVVDLLSVVDDFAVFKESQN